jgi:hypothetical protein
LKRKVGCCCGVGLECRGWAEKKREKGGGRKETFSNFQKPFKQVNSNTQNNAPACMQQGIPIFH